MALPILLPGQQKGPVLYTCCCIQTGQHPSSRVHPPMNVVTVCRFTPAPWIAYPMHWGKQQQSVFICCSAVMSQLVHSQEG